MVNLEAVFFISATYAKERESGEKLKRSVR